MEIQFKNKKMMKTCENDKELVRSYGAPQSQEIKKRLSELHAAETLSDIQKLPQTRFHQLKGDLKNHFSVDLKHPYRLIFSPLNGNIVEINTITKVSITDIVDYH